MSFSTFISSAIVRAIACIGIAATLLPTVPSQTHEVNPAPAPNTTSQAMQPSTNQTPPSAVPQTTPNPPSQATQTPTNQASPSAGPQTTPSPGTQTTQPPANQTLPGTGPQTTPNPSSQATQPPANQTPPGTGPQTTSTPSGQATQPTTNQTPSGTGPQTTSTPSGQATQPSTNRTNPSARTRTTGGFLPLWSITPSSIFDLESTKSVPNGTPPNTKNPNGNSGVTPTSTQLMTEALHFRLGPEYNNPEVNVTYQLPGESGLAPAPVDQGVPGGLDIVLPADKAMLLVQFEFCSKSPCNANQLLDVPGTLTPERMSDLYPGNSCPSSGKDIDGKEVFPPCTIEVVFVRELIDSSDEENPYFTPAFIVSKEGLEVDKDLIEMSTKEGSATFLVNGLTLKDYFAKESSVDFLSTTDSVAGGDEGSYQSPKGWQSVQEFIFARYPAASSCLPYAPDDEKEELDVMRPDYEPVNLGVDNGIILYPPKVFDVVTLRQMLATTAAQLAGITGFSPASITGAFGNLQGVTTDISYLSAQVTTVPTAVVTSQAVNGNTGNNTVANVTGQNAAVTNTNSNITCPAGTLPGIGTSGLPACVALTATNTQSAATSISAETQNGSTASSNSAGSTLTTSGAGNLNGGSSLLTGSTANNGTNSNNSNTTVHGTNQQNTTTTTSGGQAGTISAVPVSNAPSAPTNVGVSAQDILTEQVQLNSQITTLRLALQGALSDQYLVSQGNATGTRQQTTLGINISLDPPQRYKHAVAEVRLWVYAVNARKPVSIVNLLPAAKTYNVAKITNNQKAFGAGVVIDPVNVGVAGGKTKNRLYLAKDTDTVALEYLPHHDGVTDPWPHGAIPVGRSAQENIRDPVRESEIWQTITDACADDPGPSKDTEDGASNGMANPVVLGWQFRPVLGADYVQGGMRQVFAQLAMPNLTGQMSAPKVFIQTRWREYDSKRQVVGQVYKGSCSLVEDLEPIMVQTPLKVQRVHFDDMGGGVLKVKAEGQFLAQGFSAMSGPNTLSPTTFDGTAIQFFANANNLLMADDLKLVAENGVATTLGVEPVPGDPAACDIEKAKFQAVPRPDGNSWVEVKITLGNKYDLNRDKAPNPLVLIGSQVYGLHETPFLRGVCASDSKTGVSCTYNFLASTSVLRSAQTYLLRDLSWTNLKKSGKIDFDPSFGSLTALVASSGSGGTDATATGERTPAIYTLSGTDLLKISHLGTPMCHTSGCLEVFEGLSPFYLNADNFQVSSPTNGAIAFGPQTPTPVISLKAKTTTIIISAGTNSNDAKQPPSPSLCPPASKGKAPAVCQPKKQQVAPTDQTQFFYTIDGSTPSVGPNSRLYSNTSPIVTASLQAPTVFIVKAIAVAPNQLPSPIAVGKFYKVTKTTILPQYSLSAPQSSFKSYRFVWHSKVGYPVEWDLSVPAAAAAATVTASTILNVGDSTEVDFSGVNVLADSASTPITFAFDDVLVPNPLFSYDATKKTLKLMITTAMTSKPGHKVIVMNGYLAGTDGNGTNKPTQVLLPFDVTRR